IDDRLGPVGDARAAILADVFSVSVASRAFLLFPAHDAILATAAADPRHRPTESRFHAPRRHQTGDSECLSADSGEQIPDAPLWPAPDDRRDRQEPGPDRSGAGRG